MRITRFVGLIAVACGPKLELGPTAEPMRFTTSKPAREVVQVAERELLAEEFEIVKSETEGGILVARRFRTANLATPQVSCSYPAGSTLSATRETVFTFSLKAVGAGDTVVEIASGVRASDAMGVAPALRRPDSSTECTTGLATEKRVKELVAGR